MSVSCRLISLSHYQKTPVKTCCYIICLLLIAHNSFAVCNMSLSASTKMTCFDSNTGAVNLSVANGTAPYSFSWSNGSNSQDIAGLAAGTYKVTVTDNNSCTATATAVVTQETQLLYTE